MFLISEEDLAGRRKSEINLQIEFCVRMILDDVGFHRFLLP